MQTKPANWGAIFAAPHKTEYRFVIDGTTYSGGDIRSTPTITKPLLDKPALGRVCTGSLSVSIHPTTEIPKAATVHPYCRLVSADGGATDWVPQGKFYISTRSGTDPLTLNCLDGMIKAGTTYRDKTSFEEWPVSMQSVVTEIAQIMGVQIDPRTVIKSGSDYVVTYPNEDTLLSEVLGMIGAAHGGNWIMTESGKLRLVIVASPRNTAHQVLGKTHSGFQSRGKSRTITRVTLSDSAKNEFTSGDDTGMELGALCEYATQAMVGALCSPVGSDVFNGQLNVVNASTNRGELSLGYGLVENGLMFLPNESPLYGVRYTPYTLTGAYLDPCIELGDTVSVTDGKGMTHLVIAQSIKMSCTVGCTASLSASVDGETEDEYPYMTMQELSISRAIRSDQTYYGNRITRSEGFVSELLINGEARARLTANASVFSMQTRVGEQWVDRIYFDNNTGKYVISADVTMTGVVTLNALSEPGQSVINGSNITTGAIKSADGRLVFDLTAGTLTVGDKDIETALTAAENSITLLASSQMFTQAAGTSTYSPSSITLTAESRGGISSYAWYKNGVQISGATGRTLFVSPSDISGNSATYKVVGRDAKGNTSSDVLSIAKIAEGVAGKDGYTVLLSNEFIEVPVGTDRKPTEAKSYTSTVSVFMGTTALTPVLTTPTAGQFKVTVTSTPSGVTVKQDTAGTLTLTVAKSTAIADSAVVQLSVAVNGASALSAAIVVQGNMNAVVVTQQAKIETMNTAISLRVTETTYHNTVPTYNVTDPSTSWSDAQKTANTGYLWCDNDGKVKKWTGTAWEVATAENASTWATKAQSAIDLNSSNISLKVSKGSIISEINQSAEEVTISASKVNLSGYVTVTGLSNGTTTINGACITTGTIDASKVMVSNLDASNIKSGSLSATYISGGTLDCANITVKNLSATSITTGTMSADRLSGGTIDASKITVSNLNASNIKSGTLNCSNITVSNLSATSITTGTMSADRLSGGTIDASKITVKNLSATSITTGTMSADRLSGGTIDASKITVSNLNASNIKSGTMSADYLSGGTIDASKIEVKNIDASKITTGKISADRIDTTNMYVQNIYAPNSSSYRIAIKTSGSTGLYVGGDGSWNVSYLYFYADYSLYIGKYNWSSERLIVDISNQVIRGMGSGSSYGWSLGNSSYPFYNIYANNLSVANYSDYSCSVSFTTSTIKLGNSSSKIGFFGVTAVARKSQSTISTSATLSSAISALNTLINNLKGYGLLQ